MGLDGITSQSSTATETRPLGLELGLYWKRAGLRAVCIAGCKGIALTLFEFMKQQWKTRNGLAWPGVGGYEDEDLVDEEHDNP